MKKLPLFFAVLIPLLSVGCGESLPPPPAQGSTQENWPDEVKEAEARFLEKHKSKPAKASRR